MKGNEEERKEGKYRTHRWVLHRNGAVRRGGKESTKTKRLGGERLWEFHQKEDSGNVRRAVEIIPRGKSVCYGKKGPLKFTRKNDFGWGGVMERSFMQHRSLEKNRK